MNPRSVLTGKLILICGALCAAGLLWHNAMEVQPASATPTPAPLTQEAPSSQDLQIALYRCGLDPKSLTAAGVSSQAVSTVVGDFREQATQSLASLTSADQSVGTARQQVDSLERLIQSGKGSAEDVTSLTTARTSLASAMTSQQSAIAAMFNAGTAHLSENIKTVLQQVQANKQWELPLEYLTVTRTQEQWVALRNALANERISQSHDQEPDAEAQTLLSQVRADVTVSAAVSNLETNLPAIGAAWSQAVANPS